MKHDDRPLHLVTQDGQPYGSVRRCCERCGVMAGPHSFTDMGERWTDDPNEYELSEDNCRALGY